MCIYLIESSQRLKRGNAALIYRWEYRGLKRFNNLPKFAQLVSGGATSYPLLEGPGKALVEDLNLRGVHSHCEPRWGRCVVASFLLTLFK